MNFLPHPPFFLFFFRGKQRCAQRMGALTKHTALVNYATRMAVRPARSMAAPLKQKQEAYASCMVQTNLPGTAGVLQGGIAWQKPPKPPCFLQCPPLFSAFVLQLIVLHVPFAPCLLHTPRAIALAVQPSTEHGFPPCVLHS